MGGKRSNLSLRHRMMALLAEADGVCAVCHVETAVSQEGDGQWQAHPGMGSVYHDRNGRKRKFADLYRLEGCSEAESMPAASETENV